MGRRLLIIARHGLAPDADGAGFDRVVLEGPGTVPILAERRPDHPSELVKEWGQAPGRTHDSRGKPVTARSQSPFFHKLSPLLSLDDALDARYGWIDAEAARLADRACGAGTAAVAPRGAGPPSEQVPGLRLSFAWIDALALRYAMVRWLRVMAFFTEVQPVLPGDEVELRAAAGRDDDYAKLLDQVCWRAGAGLTVRWSAGTAAAPPFPPNPAWRRWLGRLARAFDPSPARAGSAARVVVCGNPRVLDPVCARLVQRGAAVWWLYDRFALRSWLRWRPRGVGQLVCDSSQAPGTVPIFAERGTVPIFAERGTVPIFAERKWDCPPLPPLDCRGFDLGPAACEWITRRAAVWGPRFARLVQQVGRHFGRVRPTALVVDEDATPLARIAVGAARACGARSRVVQHGAPCVRFGFAPLAADAICAWGGSSARQLVRWGVPPERIEQTGSPWHDELGRALGAIRPGRGGTALTPDPSPAGGRGEAVSRQQSAVSSRRSPALRVLLLATVPPRDDRPDPVSLHLTRATYAGMIDAAFAAVARLRGARLTVRPHPRAPNDPFIAAARARFPTLAVRVVRGGPLAPCLAECDCALSCVSSSGIDALLAGVPVIQLLPQGAGDVLPAGEWGFAGSARTEAELGLLLAEVFGPGFGRARAADPRVFGPPDHGAAARIADAVLGDEAGGMGSPGRWPAGAQDAGGESARATRPSLGSVPMISLAHSEAERP